MRGLAAKAVDRFSTAREMCVALGRCGIREEPSIAVGEWVATLAIESLTHRMAKVAALESQPGSDAGPGESTRTALTLGGGPMSDVTRVTGADFAPTSVHDRSSSDPPSAVVSATLNTGSLHTGSPHRKARSRVLGGVAMVALVLVCGAFALARSMRVRPPSVTLRDPPGLGETKGAEMTSAVLARDVLPALALPSSATSAAVAPRKDPRSDSASSHRAGPALPARARSQPALPVSSDDPDNVFKTRE
jgi:hypothetical protein